MRMVKLHKYRFVPALMETDRFAFFFVISVHVVENLLRICWISFDDHV